jgi:hypothetical protein
MRKILAILFVASAVAAYSQPKKAPKMAPILEPGYYVGQKGDTVRGEVQTNPDDETDIYKQFNFKLATAAKVTPITTKKAKAYGFSGRHFVLIPYEGGEIYVERLAQGRLNFFEYRFNGKIDGYPAVEAAYFIQDNRAEGDDASLKELNKISNKFYKRDLRPYMKDQLMIWTDLDKFTFNKNTVVNAINEFNKYYVIEGN